MSTPMPPDAVTGFPVMLDLSGQPVLVVGGDDAAAETCRRLAEAGARIRVVDPEPGPAVRAMAEAGALTLRVRPFAARDLHGVRLCHVALSEAAAARVAEEARRRGVLVNALARPAPEDARRGGHATLVGAGPGDAGHLTLAAVRAIRQADVILYDKLVGPGVLDLARPGAARIDVGKRCGRHVMNQEAINRLILRHARAGAHVVRLKGGDPFVFGRGGEEADALREAGFTVEVIPGVTAALAAAARMGIPLTHRGAARSLHLLTAHGREGGLPDHDWDALARLGGTLAVYMGARTLPALAGRLLAAGMPPATPAVAVESATLPGERRLFGTLGDIAARVAEAACAGPTLVLVGEVVALAPELAVDGKARRAA